MLICLFRELPEVKILDYLIMQNQVGEEGIIVHGYFTGAVVGNYYLQALLRLSCFLGKIFFWNEFALTTTK